jgi:predicted nucleic-acid-binding Zn-ribbon protein
MPFMPLRKQALPDVQAKGCPTCGSQEFVLHHYTSQGGIKQSEVINHSDGYRAKGFSKSLDFSEKAFCGFACFEAEEAKRIPMPKWKPKRPF